MHPSTRRIAIYLTAIAYAAWLAWYYRFAVECIPAVIAHFAAGAPLIALADEEWRGWLQRRLPHNWRGGGAIWLFVMMLVVANNDTPDRFAPLFLLKWGVYVALPIIAYALIRNACARLLAATALIAIPVGQVPTIFLSAPDRDILSFHITIILVLALLLLLVYKPEERVRYTFLLDRAEARLALLGFLLFAAVALPLAMLLGFVRPGFGEDSTVAAIARFLELYFFVALAEEVVFRGFLQTGFERCFGQRRGLIFASVVFGLSHIGQAPAPNWKYVVLATGGGLVYGWIYQKTRNISASVLTHALVDWTWFVLFAGMISK